MVCAHIWVSHLFLPAETNVTTIRIHYKHHSFSSLEKENIHSKILILLDMILWYSFLSWGHVKLSMSLKITALLYLWATTNYFVYAIAADFICISAWQFCKLAHRLCFVPEKEQHNGWSLQKKFGLSKLLCSKGVMGSDRGRNSSLGQYPTAFIHKAVLSVTPPHSLESFPNCSKWSRDLRDSFFLWCSALMKPQSNSILGTNKTKLPLTLCIWHVHTESRWRSSCKL